MLPKLLPSLPSLRSPPLTLPPAPCPLLLGCNDPPATDEQWESIHAAINRATDILKAFNDQNDATYSLKRLPSLREEALSFIQTHQNVVSPIRRIPAEIWSTIFYHYTTSTRGRGHRHPQYVLARVCRRWRGIVYGAACLWTCPPAVYLSKHGTRASKDWSQFKSYIDRATGHPLTLDIITGYNEQFEDVQRLKQLISQAQQWDDVTAKMTFRVLDSSFASLQGSLVNLRKFDLAVVGSPLRKLPDDLLAASTKLIDVVLWTIRIDYWPILPPQVLRLESACNHYKNFFTMVQHAASSLEHCRLIWGWTVPPNRDQPTTPLTFPRLHRLIIEGFTYIYEEPVDELISQVTLPSLKYFSINFSPSAERLLSLVELFKRSTIDPGRGHCLHTLSMKGLWWWGPGSHYSTLFRQLPNLVELHVDWLDFRTLDDLTDRIASPTFYAQPPLLPKLARLFVYRASVWSMSATYLKNFIRSRSRESSTANRDGAVRKSRCAKLEHIVLTFQSEKAYQKTWSLLDLDPSAQERKAESVKLRSLSGPLYSTFKGACASGKTKAFTKILSLVEEDSQTYDIRSIMDARLPSVFKHVANSDLCPSLRKRAQDILDAWELQIRAYAKDYHWHRYPTTPDAHAKTKLKLMVVYHQGMQHEDSENPFVADSRIFSRSLIPKWRSKEYEQRFRW
ncbi:hypothetical protein AX16_007882 [Volvariella volvacea WC 439]|nr:hypothetical protein AX16_007882 [Volvariella volvacea WC 439]